MIYLDNASSTQVDQSVLDTYQTLLKRHYANSESLYDAGVEVHQLLEKSRALIAEMFHVLTKEVIFTSGASEANNMTIKGIALALLQEKRHCITTNIEHASVKHAFDVLEKYFGIEVTRLSVNEYGVIEVKQLEQAIRPDTGLVSIMMVNNEIGSIMPISEIAQIVKKKSGAFLHVDAVQALGKLELDIKDIDCLSISAHKIHGLKGSGVLIKKQHVPLVPLISGGIQEFSLRGGTSNALTHIVLAKTIRLALANQKSLQKHCEFLKQYLVSKLEAMDEVQLNSSLQGVCHIVNFSTPYVSSEVMMNAFNQKGICVSAHSTCTMSSKAYSEVVLACTQDMKRARSSIRVSFNKETCKEDLDFFVEVLKENLKNYAT